jgi:2-polyprenyl-3-methyl-5-hydroxy-6-metoxy-1,4-benzoquinol methylase
MSWRSQFQAFQKNAGAYDVSNEQRQRTMKKKAALVVATLTASPETFGQSILEVGCGTGLFTEHLAERLPSAAITASDAFQAMLDRARPRLARFPNTKLQQYDAQALLGARQRYDVVCGCDIIHHLDDPVRAMRNWGKAMNPGGRLVFFETNAWNPILFLRNFHRPEEARFKYSTHRNLSRWLPAAGWQEAKVDYAPIYLPTGPRSIWQAFDAIEEILHKISPLRLVSGGLLISAKLD